MKRIITGSARTSTDWSGPFRSEAFCFARKDTHLTCVSLTPVFVRGEIPEYSNFAKCFFQLDSGHVRQVSVDRNGEWKVDGDILL